jgi:hypothetical protein
MWYKNFHSLHKHSRKLLKIQKTKILKPHEISPQVSCPPHSWKVNVTLSSSNRFTETSMSIEIYCQTHFENEHWTRKLKYVKLLAHASGINCVHYRVIPTGCNCGLDWNHYLFSQLITVTNNDQAVFKFLCKLETLTIFYSIKWTCCGKGYEVLLYQAETGINYVLINVVDMRSKQYFLLSSKTASRFQTRYA